MFRLFFFLSLTILTLQTQNELNQFNQIFRNAYQQARKHLLENIDPMIIAMGADVTLIHRGERISFVSTPQSYHNLKTIAHVSFAIYLQLFRIPLIDRNLSLSELNILKSYLREIRLIRVSLKLADFLSDTNLLQTQFDILDGAMQYLRSIIRLKTLDHNALTEFCRDTAKLFSKNIQLAARAQLDEIHAKVYPWFTKTLNQTEQQSLQVLIIGPKTPRAGFLTQQYFVQLLGGDPSIEGKRLLYVENLFDLQGALNVFGSWTLDRYAAGTFFIDETHLHRDLLMKDTSIYLKELFKE